ncbi:phospholipid/cholesterol/gamma-HCH transport system substrate-binding protein [Nocardia transvalensis]|uniref:Phospholipid/cholesterol/gamma-HCH transport system substrate-binding protein n=1 Tax=Nocardia transvalensis TaxID=37333 RepID=A0A7W9UKU7_9NOCA|nr:MlaD family protein [Nocardia transvalensis]MBB5915990.1 phospholipid/cholesterol/gamma-HCH transport system substrate-binding protein [Nocardia transvalensis]
MSYRTPLAGLILFLVVSIGLTWMMFATLSRSVSGKTETYSAIFTDVSGLHAGDDVRMAGVRVGRVQAVDLDGVRAKVTFEVQQGQMVSGNTAASVTYQNLIGQRYLGLSLRDFGDPKPVAPGGRIPVEHTEPSFDISKLLNGFEPLFSVLDPQQVDNISAAVVRALQGDDGAITTLIAETASLAQAFAGPDQILGLVIDNLSGVLGDLSAQNGNLKTVLQQTRRIFDGLARQRDQLFGQIDAISGTLVRAADTVRGASPALNRFVDREPGFAQHFIDNKDKFAYVGFNLPYLLKGLARITDNGAYLDAYVCEVKVSMIPGVDPLMSAILGQATPSGRVEHSGICR